MAAVNASAVVCGAVTAYTTSTLLVLPLSSRYRTCRLDTVVVTVDMTAVEPAGKVASKPLVKSLRNADESVTPVTVCEHCTVTVAVLGA